MGLYKRHVPDRGLTWEQAVPEALCFGWIDSVSQRIDDDARRQRWTPRKPASIWSSVNIALVEKLTAEGRMHPAGIAAFERRREDRSGVYSHENPTASCRPRRPHGWQRMPRHPHSGRPPPRPTAARSRTGCSPRSRRPRANDGSRSSSKTARRVGSCPSSATARRRSGWSEPRRRLAPPHPVRDAGASSESARRACRTRMSGCRPSPRSKWLLLAVAALAVGAAKSGMPALPAGPRVRHAWMLPAHRRSQQ